MFILKYYLFFNLFKFIDNINLKCTKKYYSNIGQTNNINIEKLLYTFIENDIYIIA
jgi:hypothetical protein